MLYVVSVFGSGDYDRKKKSSSRLSGGLVLAITTGKKKFQSSVWRVVLLRQFLVLAITTGKKKFQLSVWAGCVTTGKKFQSSPERLRPEKKSSSRH